LAVGASITPRIKSSGPRGSWAPKRLSHRLGKDLGSGDTCRLQTERWEERNVREAGSVLEGKVERGCFEQWERRCGRRKAVKGELGHRSIQGVLWMDGWVAMRLSIHPWAALALLRFVCGRKHHQYGRTCKPINKYGGISLTLPITQYYVFVADHSSSPAYPSSRSSSRNSQAARPITKLPTAAPITLPPSSAAPSPANTTRP
jgi:hypothetical protein